jgi:parallel beta-helix repeat protein
MVAALSWSTAVVRVAAEESSDEAAALADAQEVRIKALGRRADVGIIDVVPFRTTHPDNGFASIVLTRRTKPYTLTELVRLFPESFEQTGPTTLLVKDDIIVGDDARLVIAGREVRELRLLSDASRFVTITAWRGEIAIVGTLVRRITITSWDPAVGGPDLVLADGRAWIHVRSGRMDIVRADLGYLGFVTGFTSGVVWDGRPEEPAHGDVIGSRFHHNFFGVYTFEAIGMRWIGNVFADSHGYGFDPHDHSNGFLVLFNVAVDNGDHGFIFSRGCENNVMRFNLALRNGRHGLVLDDGPNNNPDGSPRERQGKPSSYNVVEFNVVLNNREVGIVVDGGTGNLVRGNYVAGNRYGIRLKDAVKENIVSGNRIVMSEMFGMYLYGHSEGNRVTSNVIDGAKAGIVVKDSVDNFVGGNTLDNIQDRAIALIGDVTGTIIVGNSLPGGAAEPIDSSGALDPDSVHIASNQIAGGPRGSPFGVIGGLAGLPGTIAKWAIWSAILLSPLYLGSLRRRFNVPGLTRFRSARKPG